MADAYQTSTALTEFHATLVADQAQLAFTDYTNNALLATAQNLTEAVAGAKVLDIPVIPAVNHAAETEGTALEYKQFSATKVTLTVDTRQGLVMAFTPYALARSADGGNTILAGYGQQIGADARRIVDSALAAEYANVGATVTGATGLNITEANIISAKDTLDGNNAPMEGRTLVVHHEQYNAMLQIARFTELDKIGSGQSIQTGMIGRIHGFDVFMDQNIVGTTDGFRHNLAFVRDPSQSGLAGANRAALAWAASPLPAPRAGALSAGTMPRISFSYDAKGGGSDVIDSRIQYGTLTVRAAWLIDIKTAD